MNSPLVSIMMPCYNSTATLPVALASLLAQTYSAWECVLVDDGSRDCPSQVAERIGDPRIRYIRLERNMGRSFARQVALDEARGEYLAMLDADDWAYPAKLERQVRFLGEQPDVVLVSTGMAIVDPGNELVGIRTVGSSMGGSAIVSAFDTPKPAPVAFAPSMIRMSAAKQAGFDRRFLFSEDADFLLRVLLRHKFAVLPEASYAYSELQTVSLGKILAQLGYTRRMFWKYRRQHPRVVSFNIARAYGKSIVYKTAFAAGIGEQMIRRRSRRPTERELQDFLEAKRTVDGVVCRFFKGTDRK